MKGCFILQRRFAYLGHEMVRLLMDRHGLSEACAYVQSRESHVFLQNQKDVPYSALILDEDIHASYSNEVVDLAFLAEFEEGSGMPTLWQFINADRVVRSGQLVREYPYDVRTYSHENMLALAQAYIKRINAFLDAEKPDFLFGSQVAGLGTLLIAHIARKRGIPTFFIMNSGLEAITCISEKYNCLTGADAIRSRDAAVPSSQLKYYTDARSLIDSFRIKPTTYSKANDNPLFRSLRRRDQWRFLLPTNLLRSLAWFFEMLVIWVRTPNLKHDYTTIQPWWYVWDRIKRKMRVMRGFDDLYGVLDPKQPYAFLALHFVPELALLVQAPFAQNEIENARNVAQALPVGIKLYVKEHPAMVGFRTRAFYRALLQIPNVVLVAPNIRATDIIRDAALIVTVTGMVGLEASLFGKPVITMGNVLYNVLSNVRRIHAPDDLPRVVKELLALEVKDDEIVRFVAAILEDGVRVDITYLWNLEHDKQKLREELEPFVELIAEKIGCKI